MFEANVYCQKIGLTWLVFVKDEAMYELAKQVRRFQREAFCKIQNDCNQRTWTVAETFAGNIMRDDESSFCFPKGTG